MTTPTQIRFAPTLLFFYPPILLSSYPLLLLPSTVLSSYCTCTALLIGYLQCIPFVILVVFFAVTSLLFALIFICSPPHPTPPTVRLHRPPIIPLCQPRLQPLHHRCRPSRRVRRRRLPLPRPQCCLYSHRASRATGPRTAPTRHQPPHLGWVRNRSLLPRTRRISSARSALPHPLPHAHARTHTQAEDRRCARVRASGGTTTQLVAVAVAVAVGQTRPHDDV